MKKTMTIEQQELNDVYKAAGAIRAVNKLIRKSVCCDYAARVTVETRGGVVVETRGMSCAGRVWP